MTAGGAQKLFQLLLRVGSEYHRRATYAVIPHQFSVRLPVVNVAFSRTCWMISSLVSRTSAALLGAAGLVLLFGPDVVLRLFVQDFPEAGIWIGQLLGAAFLGIAALNWLNRSAVLGGIYGRPVVFANLVLYFVGSLSLLRAASRLPNSTLLWITGVLFALPAVAYGWLLFRGPAERDIKPSKEGPKAT